MSISQVLFDAIAAIEAELQKPTEYGELLRPEIVGLVKRMKEVQQKLDSELTEIEGNEVLGPASSAECQTTDPAAHCGTRRAPPPYGEPPRSARTASFA